MTIIPENVFGWVSRPPDITKLSYQEVKCDNCGKSADKHNVDYYDIYLGGKHHGRVVTDRLCDTCASIWTANRRDRRRCLNI